MITEMDCYEELRAIAINDMKDLLVRFTEIQNQTFNNKGLISFFKKPDYSSLVGKGEMLAKEVERVFQELLKVNGTPVDESCANLFMSYLACFKGSLNMLIQINERLYLKATKHKEFSDKEYNDLVNYFDRFEKNRLKLQGEVKEVIKEVFL
jgi:hypothetical protein